LGRRDVAGIVWDDDAGRAADPGLELRSIAETVRSLPPLGASWRRLVDFAASYYQRSVGEIALSVLPPELRRLDDAQVAAAAREGREGIRARPPVGAARRCPS
jgi:primosomal protein N' (replication factor Y)